MQSSQLPHPFKVRHDASYTCDKKVASALSKNHDELSKTERGSLCIAFDTIKKSTLQALLKDLESGEQKILLSNHLTTIYIIYFWRNHYEF